MVSLSNLSMCDQLFVEDDFKKRTVFIGGIPLAKSNSETKDKESIELTRTETVEKSLREIALSISMGWTTLIFSPISNGKTMIVEYLSEQVNQRLIKIQCSDHMDSKVSIQICFKHHHFNEKYIFTSRFYWVHINVQINQENSSGHLVYLLRSVFDVTFLLNSK